MHKGGGGGLRCVVVAVNAKTHYLRLLCGDGVLAQSNQIIFAEAPRRTARIFFRRISLCQLQVQSTDDDLPERSVDTEMRVGKECFSELNHEPQSALVNSRPSERRFCRLGTKRFPLSPPPSRRQKNDSDCVRLIESHTGPNHKIIEGDE